MDAISKKSMTPEVKNGVTRFILREYFGAIMVALILFLTAGSWSWTAAWVLVALYILWTTATLITVMPVHPELLAERAKRKLSSHRWDQVILSVFGILVLVKYFVAGYDYRYGWTAAFPIWLQVVGLMLGILGYGLVTWSMGANAYFATVVEIQTERNQTVATSGPYKLVRHPGYLGSLLFEIGSALLLASWWTLLIGLAGAVSMIIRTVFEDRLLQKDLPGYTDFAAETRYKLIPGIW